MEEYKLVFDNYYISNFGNIKRGEKILGGSIMNRGYRYFQTQDKNKKRTNHLIHHLVAKHFISERPVNLIIDHIDRDKLNNNVNNLRYISQLENTHNSPHYRSDIIETDKRLRLNILSRERDRRTGRVKDIRRPKGTGSINLRPENNTWRAVIKVDGVKHDKTFITKEEGEEFLLQYY